MRTNTALKAEKTHEGATAQRITPEQQLRRAVMACLLFEDQFYESGEEIGNRIAKLVTLLPFDTVSAIAIEAREKMKLRHVPLHLVVALLKAGHGGRKMGDLISRVCQRADEPAELLAMYWENQPGASLTKQLKLGLARALGKFSEYDLAKYNRDGKVKLRDVLFLSHAHPDKSGPALGGAVLHYNKQQRKATPAPLGMLTPREQLFKRLVDGELVTPDTWETALSAGADKKEAFERLMAEGKLGALAFLRNLRNMHEAGIAKETVWAYAQKVNTKWVLPFRFITAARIVPEWEDVLEPLMMSCLEAQPKLAGRTVLLVDVSGSMDAQLSGKSQATRMDAAMGLGVLAREVCENIEIFTFSDRVVQIAPRHGFALRDAMASSQPHSGTQLQYAVQVVNQKYTYDRIVVITDEQAHDGAGTPKGRGFMINVASYKNGVGYGAWIHIDGWSEAVINYIKAFEEAAK